MFLGYTLWLYGELIKFLLRIVMLAYLLSEKLEGVYSAQQNVKL